MRKIIVALAVMLLQGAVGTAQMRVVPGSFKNSKSTSQAASGSNLGFQNMASQSIDWPLDADGNDEVAMVLVRFDNFPPEEIGNVTPSLSTGLIVKKEVGKTEDGVYYLKVFVPANGEGENELTSLTFSHPRYGKDRVAGVKFMDKNVYFVELRNDKTLPVSVSSIPSDAKVFIDGEMVGYTPCNIQEVSLGAHRIVVQSPDDELYESVDVIKYVSDAEASFHYDLRKKFNVLFKVHPASAQIEILKGNTVITTASPGSNGMVTVPLLADEYTVRATLGTIVNVSHISVNQRMESIPVNIDVVEQRAITFTAKQNNYYVTGGTVTLDGIVVGRTPCEVMVDYGKHVVEISEPESRVSKRGTLKVNEKTKSVYELVLPNRKDKGHNPYRIDYTHREWGITAMYVNKSYRLSQGGSSKSFTIWGDEGSMQGVQAGIAYQPYFGWGQGLSTGIFWQGFFGEVELGGDTGYWQEHSVYIPFQYQFRLPLSRRISIGLNAGIAANIGVSNTVKLEDERLSIGYGHNDEYGTHMPERFQLSMPLGAVLQFGALQFEVKYSIGLTNNKAMCEAFEDENGNRIEGLKAKASSWSVGISLLF